MKIGIVTYGTLTALDSGINALKRKFPQADISVINNKPGDATVNQIQGNNNNFEFGAYLDLVKLWSSPEQNLGVTPNGIGPFLIVNDTLFQTHYTKGWLDMVGRSIANCPTEKVAVYGDIRRDGSSLEERPDPFLASWFFLLPNQLALSQFGLSLEHLLAESPPELSRGYIDFIENWLQPKSMWRGWQGVLNPLEKDRKTRCIYLEHRLSKLMPINNLPIMSIGEFGVNQYITLRVMDRIRTRIKAWMGYFNRID